MRVTKCGAITDWSLVYRLAVATSGLDMDSVKPTDKWKESILFSEHSPIRALQFVWTWEDLPYWVSVHFTRHKIGIEHFVSTQRTDRTGTQRDKLTQDAPVKHTCIANAQALINISRKRLCHKASDETRQAWEMLRDAIGEVDQIMASAMMPECEYRNGCHEMKGCGHYVQS